MFTKTRVIIAVIFLLSCLVVVPVGNDTVSVFCRDNPRGSSLGVFNTGVDTKKSSHSIFGIGASEAGDDIFSLICLSAGEARRNIISVLGVSTGEAKVTFSFIGISAGKTKQVSSLFGIAIGGVDTGEIRGLISIRWMGWHNPPLVSGFWMSP